MISIVTPTKCLIIGHSDRKEEIKRALTYSDKKIEFMIQNFKQGGGKWLKRTNKDAYDDRIAELEKDRMVCLLSEDEDTGELWTYSGLADFLADTLGTTVENHIEYPAPKTIPWENVPVNKMYPFQEQALEKLLESKHAGVSIGTGLGKSFIILNLAKSLGLKTVIMAPFNNIATQLYEEFLKAFGPKYVGAYFDGKKKADKLFVIASGQSLTRLQPGMPDYEELLKTKVFIADESHFTPAATMHKVCVGSMALAPYRFFFSATQMRGDGGALLLQGIIGPVVFEKSVAEGVDEGYLAKPTVTMIKVQSSDGFDNPKKAMEMTRHHLFYNNNVHQIAADIANKSVSLLGHPVLILVEEMEQFTKLLPYFKHKAKFAHGGVTKDNASLLPAAYHDSDPAALVESFNAGEIPILVGTSCVSTGTNFKSVRTLIYLQGGQSEIQVRQALGRSTRLFKDKKECMIYDFDVANVSTTHRHAESRIAIYEDVYPQKVKVTTYGPQ